MSALEELPKEPNVQSKFIAKSFLSKLFEALKFIDSGDLPEVLSTFNKTTGALGLNCCVDSA